MATNQQLHVTYTPLPVELYWQVKANAARAHKTMRVYIAELLTAAMTAEAEMTAAPPEPEPAEAR